MERDAVLGEDGEEGIGGVVKDGVGDEASGGGDQGGGGAISALGIRNELGEENPCGFCNIGVGIGVDVNVEEIFVSGFEELFP